jgi:hypothetical protein
MWRAASRLPRLPGLPDEKSQSEAALSKDLSKLMLRYFNFCDGLRKKKALISTLSCTPIFCSYSNGRKRKKKEAGQVFPPPCFPLRGMSG